MSDDSAAETAPETPPDAGLRQGFAALGERAVPRPDCPEPDRLWAAAAGEGTPAERQEIVLHTAGCASCAAAFRLARGLVQEEGAVAAGEGAPREEASLAEARPPTPAEPDRTVVPFQPRGRSRLVRWAAPLTAIAALLVVAVLLPRLRPDSPPVYRGGTGAEIRSLVGAGEGTPVLPREAAELRWTPGPPGSRYEIRLLTADGREVAVEPELESAVYRIPPSILAPLPAGTLLLWQVKVSPPQGESTTSRTFSLRLR